MAESRLIFSQQSSITDIRKRSEPKYLKKTKNLKSLLSKVIIVYIREDFPTLILEHGAKTVLALKCKECVTQCSQQRKNLPLAFKGYSPSATFVARIL